LPPQPRADTGDPTDAPSAAGRLEGASRAEKPGVSERAPAVTGTGPHPVVLSPVAVRPRRRPLTLRLQEWWSKDVTGQDPLGTLDHSYSSRSMRLRVLVDRVMAEAHQARQEAQRRRNGFNRRWFAG
jgi:hypothetical protein